MTDYKRSIVVEIDGTGAVVGARKVRDELNSIDDAARRVGSSGVSSFGTLGRSMSGVSRILPALAAGFSAIKLADYVKDATLLAARYDTLSASVLVVGRNAGYTGQNIAYYESMLRKTGITAIESRASIASMAASNMDLAKSSQLARIAQDAAVIGNINSSEAFQRLVYGIKSAQVEVLRNIGINVNFENSYKKLAEQLGKNAQELTEAEKLQARMNVVVSAGADIAGTYEAAMDSAGKKLQSTARYAEDAKVKLGQIFQPALIAFVDAYTESLKFANEQLDKLIGYLDKFNVQSDTSGQSRDTLARRYKEQVEIYKSVEDAQRGLLKGKTGEEQQRIMATQRWMEYEKQLATAEETMRNVRREMALITETDKNQSREAGARRQINASAAEADAPAAKVDKSAEAAARAAEMAIEMMQEEIARLTLSAADFEHYQIDQEFAKIAKEIGAANPLLAQWVALRREEAELTRGKEVDKELADFFGDIDKQSAELIEKAKATNERNEEILLDFSDRYREIVVGETEFKKEQIERQAEIFRKAGADEVAVAQWVAQEKLAVSRDWQDGATRALQSYADEADNAAKNVEDVMTMAFQGIEDAVVEFVKTGKVEFADLVTSINAEIARLAFRSMAAQSYDWMGGLLKTGLSMAGSYFSGGAALNPSVAPSGASGLYYSVGHHAGGIVGSEPTFIRAVNPAIFAGADRFHTGGIAGDEVPAILKRGEGVFTEGQMKALGGSNSETTALLRELVAATRANRGTKVVNAIGKGAIANELSGSEGEQVIFNHIRRNPSAVRRMLGLG